MHHDQFAQVFLGAVDAGACKWRSGGGRVVILVPGEDGEGLRGSSCDVLVAIERN